MRVWELSLPVPILPSNGHWDCSDVVWPKAWQLYSFSPVCLKQPTPWAAVTLLHGKFLLTLPPRALVSAWALWGKTISTVPCAVPPGSPPSNKLSCLQSMWSPSWPRTVGMRVLE